MKYKWEMYAGRKFIDSGTIEAADEGQALNLVLIQEAEGKDTDTSYRITVGSSSTSSYGDEFMSTAGASCMDDTVVTPSGHSFTPEVIKAICEKDWTGVEPAKKRPTYTTENTETGEIRHGVSQSEIDATTPGPLAAKKFRDSLPRPTIERWDMVDADPIKDIQDSMDDLYPVHSELPPWVPMRRFQKPDGSWELRPTGKTITSIKPKLNFQQMRPTVEETRIASNFSLKDLMKKYGVSSNPGMPLSRIAPDPFQGSMQKSIDAHMERIENMKYDYAIEQGVPIEQVHTTIIHDEIQYSIKP